MLTARVIPCLDVKDGRVVKGVNFLDLVDAGDPVEQAKVYDAAGADEFEAGDQIVDRFDLGHGDIQLCGASTHLNSSTFSGMLPGSSASTRTP